LPAPARGPPRSPDNRPGPDPRRVETALHGDAVRVLVVLGERQTRGLAARGERPGNWRPQPLPSRRRVTWTESRFTRTGFGDYRSSPFARSRWHVDASLGDAGLRVSERIAHVMRSQLLVALDCCRATETSGLPAGRPGGQKAGGNMQEAVTRTLVVASFFLLPTAYCLLPTDNR
jgi:hypothetical protein